MESKMYEIDRFKVNWTERTRHRSKSDPSRVITSITGYNYQIDNWKRNYFKEFSTRKYETKIMTKILNDNNTVTITVSRLAEERA